MSTSKQPSFFRVPLLECHSIRSGAFGLPYYCAPLVCVSEVIELITLWRPNKLKTKETPPPVGREVRVVPNRISSQLPVSNLSEWQWQTSHFVTFCHILSHFWEGCDTLAHENIFFNLWQLLSHLAKRKGKAEKESPGMLPAAVTAEAPTACGGGDTPTPAAVRPRH